MSDLKKKASGAFTLIELLIVVAIIAILAAIAVPNFLEAQTRSKVSRALADMRSMRTALEAYRIDHTRYPETDLGVGAEGLLHSGPRLGPIRLTTPVSFMTSLPQSPFKEQFGESAGNEKIATSMKSYLYVRKANYTNPDDNDVNYENDRDAYINGTKYEDATPVVPVSPAVRAANKVQGEWMIKSVGPDTLDDRHSNSAPIVGQPQLARPYDPTNGTVSRGDLVNYSDLPGDGKPGG
jgi:type II secretion system protein G